MCGMKLEVMLSLICEQYLEFHPVNIYWDVIHDLNDSSNNQGEMYPEGAKETQWQMWKIKHEHSSKESLQNVCLWAFFFLSNDWYRDVQLTVGSASTRKVVPDFVQERKMSRLKGPRQ